MEVKVFWLFSVFCLELLLQQQYPILVKAESIVHATSSFPDTASPKNGTNIKITNYNTKNTANVTKAQLQEVVNGTINNGSGEYLLKRRITKTENMPSETKSKNVIQEKKENTSHTPSANSKPVTKLTMVAPNVVLDVNALKSNETITLNNTNTANATNSINAKNTANRTISTAKLDKIPLITNSSTGVSSSNISATKEATAAKIITTRKPKKPSITLGLGDFPHLPGEPIVVQQSKSTSKLPVLNDNVVAPNAQPSQELNSGFNYYSSRDYIVPIMTVLFTIPLAIGIVITVYRRFRDCWSTRHYRRMDFLVDGMYND